VCKTSLLDNVFRILQPHPDYLEEAASKATLDILDAAIEEGIDVTFDVIICPPTDIGGAKQLISEFWRSSSPVLNHLKKLEKWEFIETLKTQELRDEIKRASEIGRLSIGMTHTKADPFWMTRFMILRCNNKKYEGQTLMELSAKKGTEPLDTLFDILIEDPDTLWLQTNDERAREATKMVFLNHPAAMPCTDMSVFPAKPSEDLPMAMFSYTPPMAYGLYADYIGSWVKEKKMLSLEDAIMNATHLPAKMLRLDDRGVLRAGTYADVVVFDYDRIRLAGDYLKPVQPPEGIEHVLVNGKVVYEGKEHTGARPGKVLRRC
jgi:N-acyl-D-amino-acid deacylase